LTLRANDRRGLAILTVAGSLIASHAEAAWTANGEWVRDDGMVRARIARCGGKICAINTWAKDPQGDEKPGDKFIMTLVATDSSHWTGSAFDPRRNISYSVDVSLEGRQLTTRGCVTGSTMCKTAAWTRIGQ
jgi:uncharacterized protein (DUF2147 family)